MMAMQYSPIVWCVSKSCGLRMVPHVPLPMYFTHVDTCDKHVATRITRQGSCSWYMPSFEGKTPRDATPHVAFSAPVMVNRALCTIKNEMARQKMSSSACQSHAFRNPNRLTGIKKHLKGLDLRPTSTVSSTKSSLASLPDSSLL